MTKMESIEPVKTLTTSHLSEPGESLPKEILDFAAQTRTWLTTESNDTLVTLWSAKHGDGWWVNHMEVIHSDITTEEAFWRLMLHEMMRRNLMDKHYHVQTHKTLYKLKCRS